MEFKSLKNIETSFRQIRLFGIVMVSAMRLHRNRLGRAVAELCRKAARENLCPRQRQEPDARLVTGHGARTARRRHVNTCDASMGSLFALCRPTSRRLNTTSTAPCHWPTRVLITTTPIMSRRVTTTASSPETSLRSCMWTA